MDFPLCDFAIRLGKDIIEMNSSTAVAEKVIVLFFVMLCGIYARKRKFLNEESTTALSALLVNITNPLLTVYAFQKTYTSELLHRGLTVLAASVILHISATLLAFVFMRPVKGLDKRTTLTFGTIFANCGFLGYPVLMALFGAMGDENGLFYGAFFTLFFNAYCWTYGVYLMNNGKGLSMRELMKKVFLNPGIIATIVGFLLFLSPITLTEGVLYDSFKMVGDMTFPLSMFITGSLLSQVDFKAMLCDKALWFYSFVKLLVLPAIALAVCLIFPIPKFYAYIIITMCAMPGASNTAILSDIYHKDKDSAARCVGLSTFLSIFTIPLVILAINTFIG